MRIVGSVETVELGLGQVGGNVGERIAQGLGGVPHHGDADHHSERIE